MFIILCMDSNKLILNFLINFLTHILIIFYHRFFLNPISCFIDIDYSVWLGGFINYKVKLVNTIYPFLSIFPLKFT